VPFCATRKLKKTLLAKDFLRKQKHFNDKINKKLPELHFTFQGDKTQMT